MSDNLKIGIDASEILRFQMHRQVTLLFANFLNVLEDLGVDHDVAMQKLYDKLPKEYRDYVDLADYMDEVKYKNLRKRILDKGNDCLRGLDETVKQFDIKIKQG